MMPANSTNVFVSYSHDDASLVAPVVKLLRVNKSLVFQDTDDIQPGKKWREQISNALNKSDLVVVFWCHHANQSDEVSKEWKVAIDQDKDLLPLLLDGTPLPLELSEFQWIDFRDVVGANHNGASRLRYRLGKEEAGIPASATPLPSRHPKKSAKSALWVSLVGIVVVIVIAVSQIYMPYESPIMDSDSKSDVVGEPQGGSRPPAEHNSRDVLLGTLYRNLSLLGFFIAAIAFFVLLLRRRSMRKRELENESLPPPESPGSVTSELESETLDRTVISHPTEIERHIANELESEILRRTASQRECG